MKTVASVGILGDFDRAKHSHWATEVALHHAAEQLDLHVRIRWIATPEIATRGAESVLSAYDGIWASPGSPYQNFDGMLAGIEHARRGPKPFLGTCGGFQYSLIEFSRNVLRIANADSAENVTGASGSPCAARTIVITPAACALPGRLPGGPKMSGDDEIWPVPGTLLANICGTSELRGEYFCSFEVNADFIPRWEAAGLRVAAVGPGGEMRAFDLPSKRFHIGTLFQPQLSSRADNPHPIVLAFLRACVE